MEPMLVQDSDGTIYVTGFNQQYPILFKSVDNGNTWSSVDIGKEEDGAIGDSDADLIICDNGSIHMAVMYFDSGEGRAISVASRPIDSNDWKWTTVAEKKVDRPWLESSPDGKVHLIWSDSTGVCYTRTPNDGITWEKQENISQRGESSHFAIGQKGEMAVRIQPNGIKPNKNEDLIAVSMDDGENWNYITPPGIRDWSHNKLREGGVPRHVEPIVWDKDSNLYYLWSVGKELKLGVSKDLGQTWSVIPIVTDEQILYYPYIAVNRIGELAITWHSGQPENMKINVAYLVVDSSNEELLHIDSLELPYDILGPWGENREMISYPLGEYQPIIFKGDDELAVVTPILIRPLDRNVERTAGFRYYNLGLVKKE